MRAELVVLVIAVCNLGIVVELVRRRKLHEHFAVLWIGIAGLVVLLALSRPLINPLSSLLGIRYGTSLLFTAAVIFLLAMCLYLSLRISRLETHVEQLAEQMTFLAGPRRPVSDQSPAAEGGAAGEALDS